MIVEVGVGAPDREAFRIIHGDLPTVEALADVVSTVDGPACTWMRRRTPSTGSRRNGCCAGVCTSSPNSSGSSVSTPAEPPLPRQGLNEVVPCVASGVDSEGCAVTLVCSVGVDLDLVPFVAEVQATADDARSWSSCRRRDLMSITTELAALLHTPVTFATVDCSDRLRHRVP